MFLFYSTHKHPRQKTKPSPFRPVVKERRAIVKRFLPGELSNVHLRKDDGNGNSEQHTGLNEKGYFLFRDIISNIAPALKNLN
jgi:hypothetical protein